MAELSAAGRGEAGMPAGLRDFPPTGITKISVLATIQYFLEQRMLFQILHITYRPQFRL